MALTDLLQIRQLFGKDRGDPGPEAYRELLVMVLARATDVDAHTDHAEVETVQKVLSDYLDEDISAADVRVAAKSALYETAPLEKYVSDIGPRLPKSQRIQLVQALIEVLRADDRVASAESNYFNRVCEGLQLSFADVAGLSSD